jgi:hypothetical protein
VYYTHISDTPLPIVVLPPCSMTRFTEGTYERPKIEWWQKISYGITVKYLTGYSIYSSISVYIWQAQILYNYKTYCRRKMFPVCQEYIARFVHARLTSDIFCLFFNLSNLWRSRNVHKGIVRVFVQDVVRMLSQTLKTFIGTNLQHLMVLNLEKFL